MEMDDTRRWVLLVVLALVVIGPARVRAGPEHHRGPQQVGALGDGAPDRGGRRGVRRHGRHPEPPLSAEADRRRARPAGRHAHRACSTRSFPSSS